MSEVYINNLESKSEELEELDNNENLEDEKELSIKRFDVAVYPADYTLSVLFEKLKSKDIIVPEFQRGYVWTIKKASRLIESFLLGLPVPPIYLYMRKDGKLLIIDGQQRCRTIQYFFEGKFPSGSKSIEFKLKFLDTNNEGDNNKSKWENKGYKDLEDEDRRFLDSSVMRAFIIRQINPDDESSMFYIFERLNTGGVSLEPMEIRKALYYGNLFKLIEKLNLNEYWRKIIGTEKPHKRLRDLEYILRFFALYKEWKNYEAPMKDFLTKFITEYKDLDNKELKSLENIFIKTVNYIYNSLGEKPFHTHKGKFDVEGRLAKFKRLNLAVMDAFMVGIATNIDKLNNDLDILKNIYDSIKENKDFYRNITERDTTRTKILKERLELINRIIAKYTK